MVKKQQSNNVEINILVLFYSLWKQKWLILVITFFGLIAAITYLTFANPIYEARAFVSPPRFFEVEDLNNGASKFDLLPPFTAKDSYDIFIQNLLAESTKRQFFNDVFLKDFSKSKKNKLSENITYNQFSKSLSISELPNTIPANYRVILKNSDPAQAIKLSKQYMMPSSYQIILKNYDPAQAVELLKQYIDFSNKIAIRDILTIINFQNESITKNLALEIMRKREIAKAKRDNRLTILKEALNIAKATETQNKILLPLNVTITDTALNSPNMLYLRGSRSLEGEIENLTKRVSDDPLIPEMHQIKEQYKFYKNIKINKNIDAFHMDGEIYKPKEPTSPNKLVIITRSILLAFVLAIAFASFRHILKLGRTER